MCQSVPRKLNSVFMCLNVIGENRWEIDFHQSRKLVLHLHTSGRLLSTFDGTRAAANLKSVSHSGQPSPPVRHWVRSPSCDPWRQRWRSLPPLTVFSLTEGPLVPSASGGRCYSFVRLSWTHTKAVRWGSGLSSLVLGLDRVSAAVGENAER